MQNKVMIGVATAEMGRHASFYDFFNVMTKPEGTVCTFTHGQSPATNRNVIIEAALEHDCTHVLILDDDMVIPVDTLPRLLAHDVDIVSGYYLARQHPHQGLIFDKAEPDGQCHWYEVKDDETGLREVVAAGLGCCLFKTHIFENLEKPWVRLGEIQKDGWCDDIGLFKRIREAGYKIHMDLDVMLGHISSMIVKPMRKDNAWFVEIGTFTTETIAFPMVRRRNELEVKEVSKEERVKQIYARLGEILAGVQGRESDIPVNPKNPHEYWMLKRELNVLTG